MKNQISTAIVAAALMCISSGSILAQARGVKTVYVADPTISSSNPQDDQKLNKRLADAAVVFVEVRLNSLKDLNVKRSNSPCGRNSVQATAQSLPAEISEPDSYEVKTAIRTLGVSGLSENQKELVLDFELVKSVKCIKTTLVHRSAPISEKTAFDAFVQMGDVLEVKLLREVAAPTINVDVSDISAETESLRPIRDDLIARLFARLASETDFRVRDIRGTKPSEEPDYIVTGILTKDKKGVRFTIRNAKDSSKSHYPFVGGPTDQKNAEALDAFYVRAAEAVVNYIRVCPSTSTPLTDEEVGNTIVQAAKLFCKNDSICEPKPSEVILLLTRLSCAGKQTPESLKLLGDAYVLTEDFVKAADTYNQSWKMLSPDRQEELVSTVSLEGDAWYRAENYRNAAQSYELAIAKSPDRPSPREEQPQREGIYLQRARSYRFAADRQHAFTAALDGLIKYPTSNELGAELALAVNNIPQERLRDTYNLLLKNKDLDAVTKVLPSVQEKLAEYLLEQVSTEIKNEKNLSEADQLLKVVETLPLPSFRQEIQDAYKMLRAVWQSEANNDFTNAVNVLKPLSEQTSYMGRYARYFLANTYYSRARQANDKADYEKAVILFKNVIEGDLVYKGVLLYSELTLANHELGKDQDTRNFMEERLQKDRDANAALALISLCVNYLKDLACADRYITQFEADRVAASFELSKLELHVLHAEYNEAENLLHSMGTDSYRIIQDSVTLFYRVWTLYGLQKDAEGAFVRWQYSMKIVRWSDERNYWLFDAANRGLDAETKLSTEQKNRLREMIRAMVDKFRPLPK